MTALEKVRTIDQRFKDCVFGYTRQVQKQLPSDDNVYFTIPTLVIHWILLYFYETDKFDSNCIGDGYELSEDDKVLKKVEWNSSSVYLLKIIEYGVHKWTFKLREVNEFGTSMTIAIWKTKHEPILDQCLYNPPKGTAYGWMITGGYLICGDSDDTSKYGKLVHNDDIIEMILDLNDQTLRYFCNQQDFGIAYQNIELTSYRAALSIFSKHDCIELVSYRCVA